jgi:hypothetical protein
MAIDKPLQIDAQPISDMNCPCRKVPYIDDSNPQEGKNETKCR